jgi:hypothetical protein
MSWDDNPDLFGLKISRDIARAFVMFAALRVSPPDFLKGDNDSSHNVDGPFRHFV